MTDLRARVMNLEDAIRQLPGAIIGTNNGKGNGDVEHYFANGVYCRSITIPAGMVLTGKIHRYECVNILAQGKVAVTNPEQEHPDILEAPHIWVSPPGSKRALYVMEDVVWITAHPAKKGASEDDLEDLEKELTANSYEQLTYEQQEMIE